ncbi:hypothetical protein BGZ90_005566 [Linnemannia elongata]|nr:hypothetical protein BGZ90_005566 [Linnemannia elongata]
MSMPIPIYTNPCMVSTRIPSIFYLAGVAEPSSGILEVHTIDLSNISSPKVTIFGLNQSQAWLKSAPKHCHAFLGDQGTNTNSPFHIQQLSSDFTNGAHVFSNGTVENPFRIDNVKFNFAKNFAIVGVTGRYAFAMVHATTPVGSEWLSVRLETSTAVETHYRFDTSINATTPFYYDLGSPQPVQMAGISLTQKAFAVNLADTAYVFDQAADGSMVLYSINPSQSTALQKVTMNGTPPPFAQYMTAATSSSYIALYSVDNNASRINLFDIGSKAWTGSTPLYTSSGSLPSPTNGTTPDGSSAPLGAIIGGAVGGVVLIALVLFFVIRHRRGGYKKADGNEAVSQTIEYYDHEMPKLAENYVVQQPEPHRLQQQQQQVPYMLPQVAHALPQDDYAMSPQPSHYRTHTAPNLVYATSNIQSPMTNIPVYEVQSMVGATQDPYLQPYTYAPPTAGSTHASPTFLQEQVAQSYEGVTEGSPLTTYESVPKVRGSPQATIVSTNVLSESSQSVPRNPQMNS